MESNTTPLSITSDEQSIQHERLEDFAIISEEDKHSAMLGRKDITKIIHKNGTVSYREEFCGACGIMHTKPQLLDVYNSCKSCNNVLREPSVLRKLYVGKPQARKLEILFATYGDPFSPDHSFDVTAKCAELVERFSGKDRIAFKPALSADKIFGFDPLPHKNKQLRMRYRIDNIHGTLALDFDPFNNIPAPFLMLAPANRYLRIYHAVYGHPKGATVTGRMSFDVVELVQSLVDQNGGSYLAISSYVPLARLFGDPCPGYPKDLRISFEVCGRAGSACFTETRGFLRHRVCIQSSPTVAPLIYVATATYGITPTGRRDRLDMINKLIKKVEAIEHRIDEGMRVQPEEITLFNSKRTLIEQRDLFISLPIKFIDVSVKLQKLADAGGTALLLDKRTFDPNFTFGNPCKGSPKILEVSLDCQGHDSERTTESNEMTDTGYTRNFITVKKARYNILVMDEEEEEDSSMIAGVNHNDKFVKKTGNGSNKIKISSKIMIDKKISITACRKTKVVATDHDSIDSNGIIMKKKTTGHLRGQMEESLDFRTDNAAPIIIVTRATYGEIDTTTPIGSSNNNSSSSSKNINNMGSVSGLASSKMVDVTNDIQSLVVGRLLVIEKHVNLNVLFRTDPSPGRRKQLFISYLTRGFTGNLRVREKSDCLVAGIELGYPPIPPADNDDDVVMN